MKDTIVFWHPKQLSKEYNLPVKSITRTLKLLGAKRWRKSSKGKGAVWYFDTTLLEIKEGV